MGDIKIVYANTVGRVERGLKQMLEFCEDGMIGLGVEYELADGEWHIAVLSLAVTPPAIGSSTEDGHETGGGLFVLIVQVSFRGWKLARMLLELLSQPWVSLITLDRETEDGRSMKRLLDKQCSSYGLPGIGALKQRHCSLVALTEDVMERLTQVLFGWEKQHAVDNVSWTVGEVA